MSELTSVLSRISTRSSGGDFHSTRPSEDRSVRSSGGDMHEGMPPSSNRTAEPEPEVVDLVVLPTHYTNASGTIELSAAQVSAYEQLLYVLATDPSEELRSSTWRGHIVLRWLAASNWEVETAVAKIQGNAAWRKYTTHTKTSFPWMVLTDSCVCRRCNLSDRPRSHGAGPGRKGGRRSGAGNGPSKRWGDRCFHQRAAVPNSGGRHLGGSGGAGH